MNVNCVESKGTIDNTDNVYMLMYQTISSKYKQDEMRRLALIAHNSMKPAMKAFVRDKKEL